jgi:hypothetical protein
MPLPKGDRFAEFVRRLAKLPLVSTHDEARRQIGETLNQVEDELSGVPFDQPTGAPTGGCIHPRTTARRTWKVILK